MSNCYAQISVILLMTRRNDRHDDDDSGDDVDDGVDEKENERDMTEA